LNFDPLILSEDDQLPTPIQLLMAYRGVICSDQCEEAFLRGLVEFPHLTGKLTRGLHGRLDKIVPSEDPFSLELCEVENVLDFEDLASFSLEKLSNDFFPSQGESLFKARLTIFRNVGLSVLGVCVSHAAVDGIGLACFISNCTAALRGVEPLTVFHDRSYGFGSCREGGMNEVPEGYSAAESRAITDDAVDFIPTYFVIPVERARKFFGASSLLDARLRLGA
jgi:hypothetical protein